ncbi:uncharacterized protein [Triticum aestivum]|uniref:uncharacterized protein isoform X2 n=1 Tax=Triticum aestivum TaxID=4565 RepID=UPI001D02A97B|nr:uncharacterized protein LOC123071031 isoform X2 [Triticum aestivum]
MSLCIGENPIFPPPDLRSAAAVLNLRRRLPRRRDRAALPVACTGLLLLVASSGVGMVAARGRRAPTCSSIRSRTPPPSTPTSRECRGAAAAATTTRAREKQATGENYGRQQSSTSRSSRRSNSGSPGRSGNRSSRRSNSGSSRTRGRAVLDSGGRPVLGGSADLGGGAGMGGDDRAVGRQRKSGRREGIEAAEATPLGTAAGGDRSWPATLGRRAEEEDGAEGSV